MPTIARVLLIANPGSRRGARELSRACRAFAALGVTCEVQLTEHPGHAEALARARSPAHDAVFALGGDGTVMEILRALQGSETPLGVLPGGTGNLVARALGIPRTIPRAVRSLLSAGVRAFDLGALPDGRVFAFAAGIGIDTAMVQRTSPAAKRRFGVLAYAATAIRAGLRLEAFTLRATVDGVEHRFCATAALVANFGSVLGGAILLGPAIRPDDGRLDLCVFTPAGVREALSVAWRMVRRDFRPHSAMHFLHGRTVALDTDPPHAAQADGELLGGHGLQVRVLPAAARLLVPRAHR